MDYGNSCNCEWLGNVGKDLNGLIVTFLCLVFLFVRLWLFLRYSELPFQLAFHNS